MQYFSKNDILDLLMFIEQQLSFTMETTATVMCYDDFMMSMQGKILFNSTCMCLQSIGEAIKQIDDRTEKQLFSRYPDIQWRQIIGMRNILSHEYLSIDPELIFDIVKTELPPLSDEIKRIINDIESGRMQSPSLPPR